MAKFLFLSLYLFTVMDLQKNWKKQEINPLLKQAMKLELNTLRLFYMSTRIMVEHLYLLK